MHQPGIYLDFRCCFPVCFVYIQFLFLGIRRHCTESIYEH